MQEKLTLQLFACKDWKVEKMTICRWQRETQQNDKNITEIQLRSKRFCHVSKRSWSHLQNNYVQQRYAHPGYSTL